VLELIRKNSFILVDKKKCASPEKITNLLKEQFDCITLSSSVESARIPASKWMTLKGVNSVG
jgi:hypothetical protein